MKKFTNKTITERQDYIELHIKFGYEHGDTYTLYVSSTDDQVCEVGSVNIEPRQTTETETETETDEKRLWKYKLTYYSKPLYGPSLLQEELSNVRELTTDEAINWLDESIKLTHRDCNSADLYYKKDGEWVLYDRSCIKH